MLGGPGNGLFSEFSVDLRARMKIKTQNKLFFVTFSFGLKLMGIDRPLDFVSLSTAVLIEPKWKKDWLKKKILFVIFLLEYLGSCQKYRKWTVSRTSLTS